MKVVEGGGGDLNALGNSGREWEHMDDAATFHQAQQQGLVGGSEFGEWVTASYDQAAEVRDVVGKALEPLTDMMTQSLAAITGKVVEINDKAQKLAGVKTSGVTRNQLYYAVTFTLLGVGAIVGAACYGVTSTIDRAKNEVLEAIGGPWQNQPVLAVGEESKMIEYKNHEVGHYKRIESNTDGDFDESYYEEKRRERNNRP